MTKNYSETTTQDTFFLCVCVFLYNFNLITGILDDYTIIQTVASNLILYIFPDLKCFLSTLGPGWNLQQGQNAAIGLQQRRSSLHGERHSRPNRVPAAQREDT